MESRKSEPNDKSEESTSEDSTNASSNESNDHESPLNNQDSKNSDERDQKPSDELDKNDTYTPIIKFLENNSTIELSYDADITSKLMIIFGLAARLYTIHENNSTNVNITPDYIFLDDNFSPYIDLEKLNSDSKKANADSFLLLKDQYKLYFPPEISDDDFSLTNDIDSKNRVDVYIYGCLCYSLLSNSMIDETTDTYVALEDLFTKGYIPSDLKDLISKCLDDQFMTRPLFSDILYIINSEEFLSIFNNDTFDLNRFKKFQWSIADDKISTIINSDYDITKLPNVRIYKPSDFVYKLSNYIYKGGGGTIYQATTKSEPHETVAYKIINNSSVSANKKRLFREVKILSSVNHYAVQNLYGYIPGSKNKGREVIITLYQKNRSLESLLEKVNKNTESLDFTQRYIIMYGMAAGMFYLHKNDIVHRDLKPLNVLINELFEPIIADFGLSKKLITTDNLNHSNANECSPLYMAPEQYVADKCFFNLYNAKQADVYSFGISIYQLFSGLEPFYGIKDAFTRMQDGLRPDIPNDFPKTISLLVQACWEQSPDMRPPFEIILQMIGHPTFIENLGNEIDMKKFKEYQRKVVDESFIYNSETSFNNNDEDYKTIVYKDVVFPSFPKNKIFNEDDFELIKTENSPFFIHQIVQKDSQQFNRFEIKDEYLNDQLILKCLKTQIQVFLEINHPTFNPLYGVIDHPSKVTFKEGAKDIYDVFPKGDIKPPVIITPYLSKGSLLLNQNKLNITQKFIILYGIAAGMYYLHKQGMTHLNLKPSNILLNDEFEPIINIDIVSKQQNMKENLLYFLPVFSFPYVAPELVNFKQNHSRILKEKLADVYSFAMVCYFLISGIHPYDSSHGFHPILMKIMRGERPITDKIIPPPFNKLIEDCWSTDPIKRPSFKVILNRIGSETFIRDIKLLDLEMFQDYQKKVVSEEFIFPIQIFSIRKREDFEVKENIGSGMFGNLTMCIDKTNNKKVAYKEIPSEYKDIPEQQKKHLFILNFPSIISLYGFINPTEEHKESVILIPYTPYKDLYSLIKDETKKSHKSFKYTKKCIVMYGVAMGMYKLHSHDIPHQDLKPSNILLNSKLEPLITDFNLLNFVSSKQSILQTLSIGPGIYLAPEAFFSKVNSNDIEYDEKKADVYSYGMLVYYIMTSLEPYENTNNLQELMTKIQEGKRPVIPERIPDKMNKLITSCLSSDPNERPSFYEIVEMISDPEFYVMKEFKFHRQSFYDYQVKLGEPQFIKFDEGSIYTFQHSGSSSITDLRASSSTHLLSPEFVITDMADNDRNPEMQYRLGCFYRDGKSVQKNKSKAFKYFKKASKQGHIHGMIACSRCYKRGFGTQADEKLANKLIETAIQKGSVDALIILARWHMASFPKRYEEAFQLLKKADEKGHPDAPAMIASLVEKKKIHEDINVIDYYKKSCNLGSYDGMFNMAVHYHYGIGVDTNHSEAIRLYILVSKCSKYNRKKSLAIYLLAKLYEETNEFQKAFNLAEFHRKKDKFVGYLLCSDFLRRGIGCSQNAEIADDYEKSARENRFVKEQLKFAMLFHHGKGIEHNHDEFVKWSEFAADNNSPLAQANLCSHHFKSNKFELAQDLGQKSAMAGNNLAMWNLARVYRSQHKYNEEADCLKKLADRGCKRALVHLGMNLKKKKRFSEAFQKFKEAADRNSIAGIFHCGEELLEGKLTDKNIERGLKLIKDAANLGCKRALLKLIDIYNKGIDGVDKNPDFAKQYQDKLNQRNEKQNNSTPTKK